MFSHGFRRASFDTCLSARVLVFQNCPFPTQKREFERSWGHWVRAKNAILIHGNRWFQPKSRILVKHPVVRCNWFHCVSQVKRARVFAVVAKSPGPSHAARLLLKAFPDSFQCPASIPRCVSLKSLPCIKSMPHDIPMCVPPSSRALHIPKRRSNTVLHRLWLPSHRTVRHRACRIMISTVRFGSFSGHGHVSGWMSSPSR